MQRRYPPSQAKPPPLCCRRGSGSQDEIKVKVMYRDGRYRLRWSVLRDRRRSSTWTGHQYITHSGRCRRCWRSHWFLTSSSSSSSSLLKVVWMQPIHSVLMEHNMYSEIITEEPVTFVTCRFYVWSVMRSVASVCLSVCNFRKTWLTKFIFGILGYIFKFVNQGTPVNVKVREAKNMELHLAALFRGRHGESCWNCSDDKSISVIKSMTLPSCRHTRGRAADWPGVWNSYFRSADKPCNDGACLYILFADNLPSIFHKIRFKCFSIKCFRFFLNGVMLHPQCTTQRTCVATVTVTVTEVFILRFLRKDRKRITESLLLC